MSDDATFAHIWARLQNGDQEIGAEVYGRFGKALHRLARQHLPRRLSAKEDPDDIVQAAFKSFFGRLAEGQARPQSWQELWGLLSIIAVRKCLRCRAHFQTARRNIGLEISASYLMDREDGWEVLDRSPTPEQALELAELVKRLLGTFPAPQRAIVELHLQGRSVNEICLELGKKQWTVYRVLEDVKTRCGELSADVTLVATREAC
jgi:RNA polymerase sigma-70 factor (ECF subfamily)